MTQPERSPSKAARPARAPRGLFAKSQFRRDARLPATARAVSLTLFAFLVGAIVFATQAPVRELARAPGTIVPTGGVIDVAHLTGGVVEAVYVGEGAEVRQGDVLARLSSPDLDQEVAHLRNTLAQTQTRREMVEGLLDRTDMLETGVVPASFSPVVANSADQGTKNYAQARHALFLARQRVSAARVTQLDDTIATLMTAEDIAEERVASQAEKLQRLDKLLKAGHVSEFRVSEARDRLGELRGEAAAAAVALARTRSERHGAVSGMAENALAHREAILGEAFDLREAVGLLVGDLVELQKQQDALAIRAPQAGIVQSVAFPVAGEVLGANHALFEILPLSADLVAEIRLSPGDIGHVSEGARVSLKLQTYDFRRFGGLNGVVASISPTKITDPDGTSHFRAIVTLDKDHIGEGAQTRPVRSGMDVSAEIQTNERTVMEYLLKPLETAMGAAFSER